MIKFVSRLDLQGSRIDRDRGIIKGVSLIALGEARGHDKQVDQRTLETVRDCAKQYGHGLRVKFNPNTFQHGAGGLLGYIPPDTIRIEGGKTLGDLHMYEGFPAEAKDYLCEIAERTPGNIGLSIEFSGDDEVINENKFARCSEIYAATIVDLPAANPTGLFSEDSLTNSQGGNTTASNTNKPDEELNMDDATIQKLATAIAGAMKPVFQETFADTFPPKKEEEEKPAAAEGDEEGKPGKPAPKPPPPPPPQEEEEKKKPADFPFSPSKPVATMTASELGAVIRRENMQFFSKTGNRSAKVSAEPERNDDAFEARVKQHMSAGAKTRGIAIARARKDSPQDYNEWMQKKHPNVQNMAVSK